MTTLVAVLFASIGGRLPWLAAGLAPRGHNSAARIAAVFAPLVIGNLFAAVVGGWLAPWMGERPTLLFLGFALITAGVSALVPIGPVARAQARPARATTVALRMVSTGAGDTAQFVTTALAMRAALPWLAGIGGAVGAAAVAVCAIAIGNRRLRCLPVAVARVLIGLAFLAFGVRHLVAAFGLV